MRIDEVVDGLIDPNAVSTNIEAIARMKKTSMMTRPTTKKTIRWQRRQCGIPGQAQGRSPGTLRQHARACTARSRPPQKKGYQDKAYLKLQAADLRRADEHPLHRAHHRALCATRARHGRPGCAFPRAQDPAPLRRSRRHAAPHFIKSFPGNETNLDWLKGEIQAPAQPTPRC
jgi:RNA polymerase primary sigma factor